MIFTPPAVDMGLSLANRALDLLKLPAEALLGGRKPRSVVQVNMNSSLKDALQILIEERLSAIPVKQEDNKGCLLYKERKYMIFLSLSLIFKV